MHLHSEMLGWLKKSSLCALVCGPIENRFSQPALGAELLALRSLPGAYAALVVSGFERECTFIMKCFVDFCS